MPAEYAAIGQPQGPAAVHAGEHRLDRDAGRRDLRQRRRRAAVQRDAVREHGPEVRRRAPGRRRLAGGDQGQGQEAEEAKEKKKTRRPRMQRARRQAPEEAQARQEEEDGGGRPLGLCDLPELRRLPTIPRRRPRSTAASSPTRRCPSRARRCAKTIALPDPGSVQFVNRRRRRLAPVGQARAGARPSGKGHSGSGWERWPTPGRGCCSSRGRCPTRCWSAPRTAPAATRWR